MLLLVMVCSSVFAVTTIPSVNLGVGLVLPAGVNRRTVDSATTNETYMRAGIMADVRYFIRDSIGIEFSLFYAGSPSDFFYSYRSGFNTGAVFRLPVTSALSVDLSGGFSVAAIVRRAGSYYDEWNVNNYTLRSTATAFGGYLGAGISYSFNRSNMLRAGVICDLLFLSAGSERYVFSSATKRTVEDKYIYSDITLASKIASYNATVYLLYTYCF